MVMLSVLRFVLIVCHDGPMGREQADVNFGLVFLNDSVVLASHIRIVLSAEHDTMSSGVTKTSSMERTCFSIGLHFASCNEA
jgi:hypothetical protein